MAIMLNMTDSAERSSHHPARSLFILTFTISSLHSQYPQFFSGTLVAKCLSWQNVSTVVLSAERAVVSSQRGVSSEKAANKFHKLENFGKNYVI